MAKWGKIKWQCTTKKIMPIEDDLSISYEVNDKNKKEAQQISFSYIPKAAMGVHVKKEIERWSSLVGKVNPLYIGIKRFGPKKLKLKSVSASDIAIYGPGKATPAPPVGPALGQHGVNIMAFTKEFNERTKNDAGLVIPVVITVYEDRSFTFITKTPPAAVLIKKACGIDKASGVPNKNKVATISKADIQKIAETKMPDLNAASIESAMSMIAGTARSMGITVED